MRKLLNTLYVTNPDTYLYLDGENIVCRLENQEIFRLPFDNLENIVCFNYMGCSPQLMGKCVSNSIGINFLSPSGHFLAKVFGETKGNVFLRVAQIDKFREKGVELTSKTMATKFANTIQVIKRSQHDNPELREDEKLKRVIELLTTGIGSALNSTSIEEIIGIEGNLAKEYFGIFDKLIGKSIKDMNFEHRTKRPPLDPVNALLSFLYTLLTSDYAAALETVGLDSYIGFCHALRSGRESLACDLVEETRCLVERFVLTLVNLKIVDNSDFNREISGAVLLNDEGRKKVITKWQEKKRSDIMHPYLKQKIPFGLLPYVQSNLLAKYLRCEIEEYPCFLNK